MKILLYRLAYWLGQYRFAWSNGMYEGMENEKLARSHKRYPNEKLVTL